MARGYLTGTLRDVATLDPKDIRRGMPRFSSESYAANLRLLDGLGAIARDAGCSLAQLALAWLLHQGEHVIPIPGTTSRSHLDEDLEAADVVLPAEILARLDALMQPRAITAARYNAQSQSEVDTEEF